MLKDVTVTVPMEWGGDDAGKAFRIVEMPAAKFEKWQWRAALVVKGSNGTIPLDIARLGPVGLWVCGVNAVLGADIEFEKLEPLLDDLMTCVTAVRDPSKPEIALPLTPFDIAHARTITWLRAEVLSLHVGFSIVETVSTWLSDIMSKGSQIIPTSQE